MVQYIHILDYLPSKNFIAIVGSLAVVLFTGWFAFSVIPSSKNQTSSLKLQAEREITLADAYRQADLDTDGDGLKDWEEILWGTNPKKGDTDGDGTVDGREVREGRDPTIAGTSLADGTFSDKLKKPEELVKKSGWENGEPQTFSQKVAADFGEQYFGAKGIAGGGALPQDFLRFLSGDLLLELQKGAAAYTDEFLLSDITVFSPPTDEEEAAAKEYLNSLGAALEENFKVIPEDGADFINRISITPTEEQKEMIKTFLTAYQNTVDFLKTQRVPQSYARLHLTLLNSMNGTLISFDKIQKVEEDPLMAFIGVQLYFKELTRSKEYLTGLKRQVLRDGLVFESEEGGAFFNQYFAQL